MSAHALLSPSGADRWLNCPPSARATEDMPDVESSYAKEGTMIHSLAEMRLRAWIDNEGVVPDYELDTWFAEARKLFADENEQDVEVHILEMTNAADEYVAFVKERYAAALAKDPSAQIRIEKRVDLSDVVPESFGTADVSIIYDRTLEVTDLKGGKGVYVSAFQNAQVRLYAWGVLKAYEFMFSVDEIVCSICQPRMDNHSSETLTTSELTEWIENVIVPGAKLAWAGGGEFKAGDWCMFCKLKFTCAARARQHLGEVEVMFREAPLEGIKEPTELTPAQIAALLEHTRLVRQWCKNLEDYATKQATATVDFIPGFKVVYGKANRKVTDEEGLAIALVAAGAPKELLYERSMRSITALEGVVGKSKFKDLSKAFVEKPQGIPTLVPESDRREPINNAAEVAALFKGATNE